MKELIELEIREMLQVYGFNGYDLPVILGSARKALNEDKFNETEIGSGSIKKLMNEVDTYIPTPKRLLDDPFLMPVEDVYSITGRGTVLSGKVERGVLNEGDSVEIVGVKKIATTCIGLEMYRKVLNHAEAGENVGILVRNVPKKSVGRGNVVAKPNTILNLRNFNAKAYLLTKKEGGRKKPFPSGFKPQFFFRTSNVTGEIYIPNEGLGIPGEDILFEVKLIEPTALTEGLRFTIREGTTTVGAGIILKIY